MRNGPSQGDHRTEVAEAWQSQPMRRLCSTRSKRRKERVASKKAVNSLLRPQISIQRRQGGLTPFGRLTCLFARPRSGREQDLGA